MRSYNFYMGERGNVEILLGEIAAITSYQSSTSYYDVCVYLKGGGAISGCLNRDALKELRAEWVSVRG